MTFTCNNPFNPWSEEDEREHALSVLEWWAVETFFRSKEDNKQWCLKVAFTEWCVKRKKIGSLCNMTLFDQDANKYYVYYSWVDGTRLHAQKDRFDIGHGDSSIKGRFPSYEMHFVDPQNDIEIAFLQQAESYPHWIGQEVTDGWLPMGLGFYRYGIIPKNHIIGTMRHQGKTITIEGKGYFEHVWGNFDYDHPLANLTSVRKTIGTYTRLLLWWLSDHHRRLPRSITFSTENNPFGYDWVWALFDNGWSLFYGNAMFWVMDGPSAGILIFTKDGKTYTEFSNITFHYKKLASAKEYDFSYPTELELIAQKNKETLHLTVTMTSESREYTRSSHPHSHWKGLAICEAPGTVIGFYDDGKQKIPLSGICKIEPQREITASGHNTLKIDFLQPPKGVGIFLDLESHLLLKKLIVRLQLAPRFTIQWNLKKIDRSVIHNKKK